MPNVNPADRRDVIGEFPSSGEQDVDLAVRFAAEAQLGWAALPAPARGEFLRKAADVIEGRLEDIALGLMREEGKSLPEARGETLRAVTLMRYHAAQTMLPDGDVIPSAGASTFLYSLRVPLGVCAAITPWNFPIAIPVWKCAPALAFGNTVVLKPSEETPLTAVHLAECFEAVGLPNGVFNLVHGTGEAAGKPLVRHPLVRAVSFTGSVDTGKHIARIAVETGKKYQLEMGGKNGVVVMPDANLESAVTLILQGAFKSAGEKCTATSRVIIHQDIYAEFAARIVERTKALKVGPGDDPAAYLGPVIRESAQSSIIQQIEIAHQQGCELLAGGAAPAEAALRHGFYVLPTVLGRVPAGMRIAREEVFGPVLCLMRAADFDEAIAMLNDIEFGLSAAIFTRDLDTALKFAERADAGLVRINGETAGVEPQAPFGGMKASSSFSREQGMAAREFYTQTKTVSIDRAL